MSKQSVVPHFHPTDRKCPFCDSEYESKIASVVVSVPRITDPNVLDYFRASNLEAFVHVACYGEGVKTFDDLCTLDFEGDGALYDEIMTYVHRKQRGLLCGMFLRLYKENLLEMEPTREAIGTGPDQS